MFWKTEKLDRNVWINLKEHIEFSTIREELNLYQVETGQILKFKIILTDVFKESNNNDNKPSSLGVQDFSVVISDVEMDTSKLEYATKEQVTESDQIKELKFKPIKEVINIYETQKAITLFLLAYQRYF